MILLGLRGQAKSRILRSLTSLLDAATPMIAGCEINDDPFRPLCKRCRDLLAEKGDATPIAWLASDKRYVEKLATPDVTIADIIGDVDPIRAARGGFDLASELTMHYGLLPRAHRGIFALNELPDLAGRIQVGLFNILQEGDVQIKGYPVRLPIDVCMVFTANPEDYTARGKIITPLKDRIGSEIRTHYPTTLEHGVAITAQEAWTERADEPRRAPLGARGGGGGRLRRAARQEDRPAERRLAAPAHLRPRERGEQRRAAGARSPASRRSCRASPTSTPRCRRSPASSSWSTRASCSGRRWWPASSSARRWGRCSRRTSARSTSARWSASSRKAARLRIREGSSSEEVLGQLQRVPEVLEHLEALGAGPEDPAPLLAAAGEFVLEGLWAQKKIGRSDDRGFVAPERRGDVELDLERLERLRKLKKQVN